jgi:hypothetical protein
MQDKKLNKRMKTIANHQGFYPELEAVVTEQTRRARIEGQAVGMIILFFIIIFNY